MNLTKRRKSRSNNLPISKRTTKKAIQNDFQKLALVSCIIILASTFYFFKRNDDSYYSVSIPESQINGVPAKTASWTSQHLLDCKSIHLVSTSSNAENGDSMFVTTKTVPPFQMDIHNPASDAVSKEIHEKGCWECGHLQGMLAALSKYPDSYFLDIGGNIGMWSLAAAAANKETFTIEPSPENYQKICHTVNRNLFHNRVHLLTIAATSKPETFTLIVPEGNKGGTKVSVASEQQKDAAAKVQAHAHTGGGSTNNATTTTNVIKGYPIDSLNLPVDRPVVMKIDVEGHELQALQGAMEFLKNANIIHVSMELRPMHFRPREWKEIFDVLVSKGLEPSRVDNNSEVEMKLDPEKLSEWRGKTVRFFDVVWEKRNA